MGRTLALPRGAFTVSIDLELLWGVWDNAPTKDDERCADLERQISSRLLELFRRYDVRATWAIVGRLLDDEPGFDGLRGPSRRCWFAPDIVEAITSDGVDHEIGSHSYAHVYFHSVTREQAAMDLRRAAQTHRDHGLPFTSFVFPRNQVGHLDVLADAGLRVFRSSDAGLLRWAEERARPLRPALNLVEKAIALPSPLVDPVVHDRLIELPSSMLLLGRNGMRRIVHPRALSTKLCSGIRRAAEERRLFHLWFHPSNFYDQTSTQLDVLERGLEQAATLRARGQLDVHTMGDFVDLAERSSAAA